MALDKNPVGDEQENAGEYQKRDFTVVGTRPIRPDGIDKVTGRAQYGADMYAPGMLVGKFLRSEHVHAKILSIDTSAAEALSGVKAVITAADFAGKPSGESKDVAEHILAQDKVLYDGHAVAAVAAVNEAVAKEALGLIKVDYEVLPHVIDVDEACKPGRVVIREGVRGRRIPEEYSDNCTGWYQFGHGDLDAGFAKADKIVERSFKTASTHQGYIEPHACLATMGPDGRGDLWCCTQGHFNVRVLCADITGIEQSALKVTASEIGGGFGGKTTVFIEPAALTLSRKAGRPVKMVMSREEVFKASGPATSSSSDIKIGMTKDGTITAAHALLRYEGGAWNNITVVMGAQSAFASYDLEAVQAQGLNALTNRPKQAAYRAPGTPQATYAVESVIDELCQELGLDPVETRLKNAAKKGSKSSYGPTYDDIGLIPLLEAARDHDHYKAPLGPNQARGISSGFWFNFGGETCVSLALNFDGTITLVEGNPDIGGSRAAMSMMAAEELGIPYEKVRTIVADTASLGHNENTHGSRVTFSVGLATIKAARAAKAEMCRRAAKVWGIDEEAVVWEDGCAKPAGPNAGDHEPMSIEKIGKDSSKTGGPIVGHHEVMAEGAGVSFGIHICDLAVDPETGHTTVERYTVLQDAGKAIHPDYVEGQLQGGAAQGIGWALNEGYIYGEDGKIQNTGFLDYRIPVASDLPKIDTVILEIPNPGHPYGVRGVGETGIVPPLAAINNAVSRAIGVRMSSLPMSPPKILKAIKDAKG